ncbi:Programmed_cell death protein-like protein [Hexamita inflata]|uniref:Programmed cell death protein-like protein n=1 Tax=Hexamita inflata TaxID=28002 RepID=A0AA86R878_9EUKA|nr:Programmed cell death protein-like protein [Hexamita inflata]
MFNMGFNQKQGYGMPQMGIQMQNTPQNMSVEMEMSNMMNDMVGITNNMMGEMVAINNTMMGGMMGMAGAMMGGMMSAVDPQAVARFNALDSDHSGTISVQEIQKAYQKFNFPAQSAQLLLKAISDETYIDIETFPVFDQYLVSFYNVFMKFSMGQMSAQAPQVQQAVRMLNFQVKQPILMALIQKYDTDHRGVEFGEFLSICSYLLIVDKLMEKFDPRDSGKITLDKNDLQALGLWFL